MKLLLLFLAVGCSCSAQIVRCMTGDGANHWVIVKRVSDSATIAIVGTPFSATTPYQRFWDVPVPKGVAIGFESGGYSASGNVTLNAGELCVLTVWGSAPVNFSSTVFSRVWSDEMEYFVYGFTFMALLELGGMAIRMLRALDSRHVSGDV